MRKFLAAIAGLIAIPAAALAADKGAPPVVAQGAGETLVLPFQGLYIGGAIGAADGQIRDSDGFKMPRDGLTASALLGYNHRVATMPGIVIGVEGDIGLTDISGSNSADGFTIKGSTKYLGCRRHRQQKPHQRLCLRRRFRDVSPGQHGRPIGGPTLRLATRGADVRRDRDGQAQEPRYACAGGADLPPELIYPGLTPKGEPGRQKSGCGGVQP